MFRHRHFSVSVACSCKAFAWIFKAQRSLESVCTVSSTAKMRLSVSATLKQKLSISFLMRLISVAMPSILAVSLSELDVMAAGIPAPHGETAAFGPGEVCVLTDIMVC